LSASGSSWNPAAEAQARARTHRIGQNHPVFVPKRIGENTFKERILKRQ
jgi:SNF2 family DNA or RNA helicase